MHASLAGLEQTMGAEAYAAWLSKTPNPQGTLEGCEARMLAFILPNSILSDDQADALCRAVYAEICEGMQDVPVGLTRFSIGDFSAELTGKSGPCALSRAILLGAGLLYRGVPC